MFSQENKKEYDYIKNYYQFVYEANYNYEIGNDTLAYNLLKKAESNCPLLNQENIYEVNILARLSMKLNKEKETFNYIELLLKKFGYSFFYFDNDSIYNGLKNKSRWKKLKRNSKKIFEKYKSTVNVELRNEIKLIVAKDQEIRHRENINWEEVDSIDRIHEERIKVIIKEFGYPDDDLIGSYTIGATNELNPNIGTLIMHFKDVNYWKPIFLDLIRKGKALANIYGNLVDSIQRNGSYFIYGIYNNVQPNKIMDFDRIDERRIAVGLSTWDLQQKMYEIVKKKYNF
ncbi:hypothetical protein SAMN05444005_101111 [Flavobacterium urocaniciphilum]|uniref:Uncharacterized protein n=1 Tax=Flavobacterium urocaniciphilum TaxID=1299341 RepID=A0A1H8YS05_9FLAO|nr:hypothetical protein SAMN05444005_101111 [Flavobacterium urocaniciphilum]